MRGIPSYDNTTGQAAQYCGPHANQTCTNYADQLYWLTRDYRFGSSTLEAPFVGATFTNVDLSWAHEFKDGAALKITPFYRRGYNVIEQTAQIIGFNFNTGYAGLRRRRILESRAFKKPTGIELLYTKEVPLGLSMQIGATYISQFGNEPPGAFLQPAALALGVTYRSPDLSPFQMNAAFNYKTAHGWRINPVIGFNVGYPYGGGYYTAVYCNGIPVIVPNTSALDDLLANARLHRSAQSGHVHQTEYRRYARHSRTGPAGRIAHDAARQCRPHVRIQSAHQRAREIRLRTASAEPVQSALQRADRQRLLRHAGHDRPHQRHRAVHVLDAAVRAAGRDRPRLAAVS